MADTPDLGSGPARGGSSSLPARTIGRLDDHDFLQALDLRLSSLDRVKCFCLTLYGTVLERLFEATRPNFSFHILPHAPETPPRSHEQKFFRNHLTRFAMLTGQAATSDEHSQPLHIASAVGFGLDVRNFPTLNVQSPVEKSHRNPTVTPLLERSAVGNSCQLPNQIGTVLKGSLHW
jgi:hypothetical protein